MIRLEVGKLLPKVKGPIPLFFNVLFYPKSKQLQLIQFEKKWSHKGDIKLTKKNLAPNLQYVKCEWSLMSIKHPIYLLSNVTGKINTGSFDAKWCFMCQQITAIFLTSWFWQLQSNYCQNCQIVEVFLCRSIRELK